jgi:predicted nucleic acid-binding protein
MGDRWLLDANVVSMLFEESCEDALTRAGVGGLALATTEKVIEELRRSRATNKPWAERLRAWPVPTGMVVLDMVIGDEASVRYEALRRQRNERRGAQGGGVAPEAPLTLKDQGELTCIAHAAADPSLVFVAHDRNALWWAVHEVLPCARIASVAGFVRLLVDSGYMAASEASSLGRNRNLRDHLPTWWAERIG